MENDLKIANTKFKNKEIHKFTRQVYSRNEKSIIDYFLIGSEIWKDIKQVKVKRGGEIGSDHYLVRMRLKIDIEKEKSKRKIINEKIRVHRLKDTQIREDYQRILETNDKIITNIVDIEESWKNFKDKVKKAAKETCGVTKICNLSRNRTSWWNDEIRVAVQNKKQAWKEYLKTMGVGKYEVYKEERVKVKILVKRSKETQWKAFGQKLAAAYYENQKMFYGALKQMRKPRQNTLKSIKDKKGDIKVNENDIMERWKEYYKHLLDEGDNSSFEDRVIEDSLSINQEQLQDTISAEKFEKALNKIKIGKAPGHDELTGEMIKYLSTSFKIELLNIMNAVKREKKTPKDWNIGIISPIYKSGDSKQCSNYRGITLSSVVEKLFARIMENRLRNKIENTLEETQCGFRKERGTQDHIFTIRQLTEKAIAKNREIHLCFIDLEKAFDRIKRQDVWKILKDRGVDYELVENIKSLYRHTECYVRVRNERSEMFTYNSGLKQGCILSPILFNIVLDTIIKNCRADWKPYNIGYWRMGLVNVSELCYADDMVIIARTDIDLQHNMNRLCTELNKYNMNINRSKTKTMIVGTTEKFHQISVENIVLEQVNTYKYLGVIINSEGNNKDEINERTIKAGKMFNAIKTSFLGKKEIPEVTKVQVIKTVVKPILTYASESWTTTDRQKSKLRATEMRFLRKIKSKTKRDRIRNEVFYRHLQIEPITVTIQQNQLRWLGHMERMNENRLAKKVFKAKGFGKRKRGRPRKTWTEEVQHALISRGVEWNDAINSAKDRNQWRRIVKRTPRTI